MTTTIILAVLLGVATSIWRWHDGRDSDKRWKHSSFYAVALSLCAGLVAYGPWIYDPVRMGVVAAVTIYTFRLLTQGFDGWEKWSYMLQSRAAPTAAIGLALLIYTGSAMSFIFGVSGLIVATTYVELTRYEQARKDRGFGLLPVFPAQQWGEISHGFFIFGLVLIGI